MLIKIGEFDFTECWDGIFYKKLSGFPKITDWEIQTILDFIRYAYHRVSSVFYYHHKLSIIRKSRSL